MSPPQLFIYHGIGNPLQFLLKLSMVFMSSSLNSKSNNWKEKKRIWASQAKPEADFFVFCIKGTRQKKELKVEKAHKSWDE